MKKKSKIPFLDLSGDNDNERGKTSIAPDAVSKMMAKVTEREKIFRDTIDKQHYLLKEVFENRDRFEEAVKDQIKIMDEAIELRDEQNQKQGALIKCLKKDNDAGKKEKKKMMFWMLGIAGMWFLQNALLLIF